MAAFMETRSVGIQLRSSGIILASVCRGLATMQALPGTSYCCRRATKPAQQLVAALSPCRSHESFRPFLPRSPAASDSGDGGGALVATPAPACKTRRGVSTHARTPWR
eukprot:365492-Chlamydomonas_euryale.AAC.7